MKIAILFLKFLPYHLARIKALGNLFEVIAVQISDLDKDYALDFAMEESGDFVLESLFKGRYIEDIPKKEQKKAMFNILNKYNPDVVIIPGWGWYFGRIALSWVKARKKFSVLMSDSKADDKERSMIKEWFKRRVVSKFDCAIAAGSAQKEYLISLGMSPEKIMFGFDVVDNEYIFKKTRQYLQEGQRPIQNKYFLIVSRFIKRKNIDKVIDAYRMYRNVMKDESWDLVLVGFGEEEYNLRSKIKEERILGVHFSRALGLDEVCRYLAFSEVLIHAAYQEQWGLVINEAMAAAKPVVVSKTCGCLHDLVRENENGFIFDPYDSKGLFRIMIDLTLGKYDLKKMGDRSAELIKFWSPSLFADNVKLLIEKNK